MRTAGNAHGMRTACARQAHAMRTACARHAHGMCRYDDGDAELMKPIKRIRAVDDSESESDDD